MNRFALPVAVAALSLSAASLALNVLLLTGIVSPTNVPGPVVLGTSAAPRWSAPNTSVYIQQQGDGGNGTVIARDFDSADPTFLSFYRSRGTQTHPVPSKPNDFVGEIRFGYGLPEEMIAYGFTIDAFAGYGPEGKFGYGGYGRFRTSPPGSNVPLTVMLLQQSVPEATRYLAVWNASQNGNVTLEAVTNDGAPSGLNIQTQHGGKAMVNGKQIVTVDMLASPVNTVHPASASQPQDAGR